MAEQTIYFRVAEPEDAKKVLSLLDQVAQESDYLLLDRPMDTIPLARLADNLADKLDKDNQLCLLAIAEASETPIAILTITGDRHQRMAHIGDLFIAVRKDCWGQGIGRLLLEEALYWAEHYSSLGRLELTVQARNERAVRLYEQVGFKCEGVKVRGATSSQGEYLDVLLMAKLIG